MNNNYNFKLVPNSRVLRNNMTKEERKLWYCYLKGININFYRQKVIGQYIVDFCCPTAKLVIELDGSQHYDKENKKQDKERDLFLMQKGYKILRYSNLEILKNFEAVCLDIEQNLNSYLS